MKSFRQPRFAAPVLAALLAMAVAAAGLRAQDPAAPSPASAASPATGKPPLAALENALAMYSPFESPWAQNKANHAIETHLFSLMRAEVRLWTLQEQLAAQGSLRDSADEISRIIHAQILAEADEALPLLQRTPNRAFTLLLIQELEAYPYEWKEEGSEELLPSLHKLADTPEGNPTPAETGRRRRHGSG